MSASIAISSAALAQSSLAAAEAAEAKRTACVGLIQSYDSKSANSSEMQAYADCVNTVYPRAMSHEDVVALKIVVVVLLISGFVGAYKFWKLPHGGDIVDAIAGFFFGVFISAMVVGVVALLWWVIS